LREPNVSAWVNFFGTLLHEVALRRLNAERLCCGGVKDELACAGIDHQIRALAIEHQQWHHKKPIRFRNMKLSRLPIGGKDRAKHNALTFDAVQSARCQTDHGSGCNELEEREIHTASQSRRR
jgi:hypothetical protein